MPIYFPFFFRFLWKNPCPFSDLRKAWCADNMHLKEHLLKETSKFTSFCLPKYFSSIQKLLSGQKCRKNQCVIQCWSCCSSQMGAQEELRGFIPFCSSMQLGTIWPTTAFWNIYVMQILKLPHFYLKCSHVSPETSKSNSVH